MRNLEQNSHRKAPAGSRPTAPAGDRLKIGYLHGGVVQYTPGETLGPRILPDYEVVLIIQGDATYFANGLEYKAPAGSILFTRPGTPEMYRWDPLKPTRHAYFHFNIEQVPGHWPEWRVWPVVRPESDPVLPALIHHILNRVCLHGDWPSATPGRLDCLLVETLLSIYLDSVAADTAPFERDRPLQVNQAINLMREVIDEDPHKRLSLGELACTVGASEKHLCRLFKKSVGHPPGRTYRLLCLQLALSLLARSNLTVQEVADRCGFDDAAYFCRYFSKVFGCPPSEVRKRARDGAKLPLSPLPVDVTPRFFW